MTRRFDIMVLGLFCFFAAVGGRAQTPENVDAVLLAGNNITTSATLQFTYQNSLQNTSVVGSLATIGANFGPSDGPRWGGENLRLNASFGNSALGGGSPGIVDGVRHDRIYFGGNLTIEAETLRYPIRYSRGLVIITRPARLSGTLQGFSSNPAVELSTPIFSRSIDIQGSITITIRAMGLIENGSRTVPSYAIKSILYDFSNPNSNRKSVRMGANLVLDKVE